MTMRNLRSSNGQSIVELLVATLIFSAVATVMLSLYSINTMELSGFYNKGDALNQATDALTRIGLLCRSARGFGDNFGVMPLNSTPIFDFTSLQSGNPTIKMQGINTGITTAGLLDGTSFVISPSFPGGGDPYYTTANGTVPILPGTIQSGNWPWQGPGQAQLSAPSGPGAPGAPSLYALAQDMFIVQVPVFVNAAGLDPAAGPPNPAPPAAPIYVWPATYDSKQTPVANGATGTLQAVDTYVFHVLPDPNVPGTWMMQEAAFPACPAGNPYPGLGGGTYPAGPGNQPYSNLTNVTLNVGAPVTVCTGIVGPLDATGNISTFSYVNKQTNLATNTPPTAPYVTSDYDGVIVNLEILKNQQGTKASVCAFRSEYYARNNSNVSLEGK